MQKTNDTYSFYTRFNGPDSGFCRLCGKKRVLTLDHIPPTSWINTHNIVLQSFLDKKQSMKSPRGLMFKTLCDNCNNNLLGTFDGKVGYVLNEIRSFLSYMKSEGVNDQKVEFNISNQVFLKSIIGHILAGFDPIASVEFPTYTPNNSFKSILHKYWKSQIDNLPQSIKIYYWVYENEPITFAPQIVYAANISEPDSIIICSLIRFNPIGIMICFLDKSRYRFSINEINLNKNKDDKLVLKLSNKSLPEDFPFSLQKNSAILYQKDLIYFGMKKV